VYKRRRDVFITVGKDGLTSACPSDTIFACGDSTYLSRFASPIGRLRVEGRNNLCDPKFCLKFLRYPMLSGG